MRRNAVRQGGAAPPFSRPKAGSSPQGEPKSYTPVAVVNRQYKCVRELTRGVLHLQYNPRRTESLYKKTASRNLLRNAIPNAYFFPFFLLRQSFTISTIPTTTIAAMPP